MRNRVSMAASKRPVGAAAARRHGLVHGDRHGARIDAGEQQGEEKLVPGEDEAEDEGGGEAGDDLRQADLEEHPDLRRAVDPRRILDVGRQLVEEALHHPDGEGQVEGGVEQDDAEIGAGQARRRGTSG